ncbi:MAG: DUF1684 domain-containing protein, partial [Rhodanobacter sp.]
MLRTAITAVVVLFTLLPGVAAVHAESPATPYEQQIRAWRDGRLERLTAPTGWLSLIGLEWLQEGSNRVGHAADNDIVLQAGPAHLGVVTLAPDGQLRIVLAADSGATVDGQTVTEAVLVDDAHVAADAEPTMVNFGTANFYVIDRDGRKGLRVKDTEAETRKHFLGIDAFAVDPSWQIEARWVSVPADETLEMGSVIGTIDTYSVPGKLEFTR